MKIFSVEFRPDINHELVYIILCVTKGEERKEYNFGIVQTIDKSQWVELLNCLIEGKYHELYLNRSTKITIDADHMIFGTRNRHNRIRVCFSREKYEKQIKDCLRIIIGYHDEC